MWLVARMPVRSVGSGSGALRQRLTLIQTPVLESEIWIREPERPSEEELKQHISEFQSDDTIQRASAFHVNVIWFPYKSVSTGFELMWGERVNKDGVSGDAWRAQYMAKFKFN